MAGRLVKLGTTAVAVLLGVVTGMVLTCHFLVVRNTEGRLFTDVDSIPLSGGTGLLLGTTPHTAAHRENLFFTYRIDAAERLYKAGVISKILISGDEDSLEGVNEVVAMRDSLVCRGVPSSDMMLDGKGGRTLDSVVRACRVAGLTSFIVISQRFHNERALYLADYLCGDMDFVIGYNAEDPTSLASRKTYIREGFARVKMFVDLVLGVQPASMEPLAETFQ